MAKKIQKICRLIVNNKYFNAFVFILIVFSIVLIFWETTVVREKFRTWIHDFNNFILYVFALELVLRLIAVGNFKDFIKEYWVDIIAILPFLPALRYLRFFRLLRLLRMVSLIYFIKRHLRTITFFLKKRLPEYLIILVIIVIVLLMTTLSLFYFETGRLNDSENTMGKFFWISVYSLFSGQYATSYPESVGGRVILVLVMFSGMGLFALLTGSITAIMVDKLKEGAFLGRVNFMDMDDHIIICGYNERIPRVISELQANLEFKDKFFVLIAEIGEMPNLSERGVNMATVFLINKDFTIANSLKAANITGASIAIVLADQNKGRTSYDADARTVLTALTIEKLNPDIYTCVELLHSEYESHLAMTTVENVVLSSKVATYVLTQSVMKPCAISFYSELLHPSEGNNLYEIEFPKSDIGRKYDDVLCEWKSKYGSLIVGLLHENRKVSINPENHIIKEKEKAIVISSTKPKIPDRI